MSTVPPTAPFLRHALGLPAGSIRALLAFGVLLYLWVMAFASGTNAEGKVTGMLAQPMASTAFIYMQVIMVIVLAHFTVAHGKTIGSAVSRHSPLWMPRGSLRLVLLGAYFGLAYWTWTHRAMFKTTGLDLEPIIVVLSVVLGAFLVGHISTAVMRFLSGGALPYWFQDIQAWFGLISLVLLVWIFIARLVINPNVSDQTRLSLMYSEPAMAAFVGFYFGARS